MRDVPVDDELEKLVDVDVLVDVLLGGRPEDLGDLIGVHLQGLHALDQFLDLGRRCDGRNERALVCGRIRGLPVLADDALDAVAHVDEYLSLTRLEVLADAFQP